MKYLNKNNAPTLSNELSQAKENIMGRLAGAIVNKPSNNE